MSTIQTRVNREEKELIQKYAEFNNITISDLIRNSVLEKIEDEIDIELYNKALEDYIKNPTTISFDEMMKDLNE